MLTARTAELACVEAAEAPRAQPYACRGCGAPVTLKRGRLRIAHFAHRPDAGCAFGAGMSLTHLATQQALAQALRARGATVELESWLPGLAGDRRIDVLAHPAGRPDRRIAIEVQQAELTIATIAARTQSYHDQDVAPLWLRLTDFARFDQVQVLPFSGAVWLERYPARSWERWAHDEFGDLWFCDSGTGRLWRGRFVPAFSWRDGSEWYEPGGVFNSTAGGFHPVTRWVGLALQGPYGPEELRLMRSQVTPVGGDAPRLAASFVAPEEAAQSRPPPVDLRRELRREGRRDICDLEQLIEGRWIVAELEGARSDWRTTPAEVRPVLTPMAGGGPAGSVLGRQDTDQLDEATADGGVAEPGEALGEREALRHGDEVHSAVPFAARLRPRGR